MQIGDNRECGEVAIVRISIWYYKYYFLLEGTLYWKEKVLEERRWRRFTIFKMFESFHQS